MNSSSEQQLLDLPPEEFEERLRSTPRMQEEVNALLRLAVGQGRAEKIGILAGYGGDLSVRDPQTGRPLLHIAVEHSHFACIRKLAQLGVPVDAVDDQGWSALHLAVDVETDAYEQTGDRPDHEAVKLLLKLGADPGLKDIHGKTPVDLARDAGWPELERVLADLEVKP
jgi:hypothetical protein